jgi:hypothetical protein
MTMNFVIHNTAFDADPSGWTDRRLMNTLHCLAPALRVADDLNRLEELRPGESYGEAEASSLRMLVARSSRRLRCAEVSCARSGPA